MNFCIQDFGLNTYSWIHILFAGWLCYACIRGFFPFQLGRKPCKGKKHTEKWKLLLRLLCSVSATCWKNTSQYQAAQRKKSCVYKTAGCWSTEQLCNLIQFVTFYHLPLPISPRCLAWGSTGTKFIPLASSNQAFPFMSSLQSTGLLESTGLLLPLGSATTDSAPFPESKRHIGREMRHKTESWDINNFTWGLLKARRGLKLSGVSWSKRYLCIKISQEQMPAVKVLSLLFVSPETTVSTGSEFYLPFSCAYCPPVADKDRRCLISPAGWTCLSISSALCLADWCCTGQAEVLCKDRPHWMFQSKMFHQTLLITPKSHPVEIQCITQAQSGVHAGEQEQKVQWLYLPKKCQHAPCCLPARGDAHCQSLSFVVP